MIKKIVLGTLLVGLIGILVVGAAVRTMDKTGNVAEARGAEGDQGRGGQGQGRGQQTADLAVTGQGRNQGAGVLVSGNPALEGATAAEEWITYEGSIVQAPEAGVDMIIATDDGQEILVGTGPGYLDEMGLTLQAGEQVQVQGYWEDDEFKAGQVTRLRDGATVALRDIYGRPAWSGAGQRQNAVTTTSAGRGQGGGGRGAGGQGGAESAPGTGILGEGNLDAPGDGLGTGQAQVDEWLTLAGTVSVANADEMIVQIDGGGEVLMEGRAWRYLQEQGFQVEVGQRLSLTGFYENDDFEVGAVENLSTGQSLSIRDTSGRPLWAGRGWRSS
jgi:hypothetical protein